MHSTGPQTEQPRVEKEGEHANIPGSQAEEEARREITRTTVIWKNVSVLGGGNEAGEGEETAVQEKSGPNAEDTREAATHSSQTHTSSSSAQHHHHGGDQEAGKEKQHSVVDKKKKKSDQPLANAAQVDHFLQWFENAGHTMPSLTDGMRLVQLIALAPKIAAYVESIWDATRDQKIILAIAIFNGILVRAHMLTEEEAESVFLTEAEHTVIVYMVHVFIDERWWSRIKRAFNHGYTSLFSCYYSKTKPQLVAPPQPADKPADQSSPLPSTPPPVCAVPTEAIPEAEPGAEHNSASPAGDPVTLPSGDSEPSNPAESLNPPESPNPSPAPAADSSSS